VLSRILFCDEVPIFGGHQISAAAAAAGCVEAGASVTYAIDSRNGRYRKLLSTPSLRVLERSFRATRWQPFLAPLGTQRTDVVEIIQAANPDAIVAVQSTIVQNNRTVEAARRVRIPVVSFIPMGLHFGPGERLQSVVGHLLAKYHYRRPDAFITTSASARDELVEQGALGPVSVAEYGPDLSLLHALPRAEARQRLGLPRHDFVIAIAGRIALSQKGHDVLLRAMTEDARLQDAFLLIVGDGPDLERVKALAVELRLSNRVRFAGWQPEVSPVYCAADVLAVPSWFEGLPIVALEALYLKTMVVGSNVNGLREVIDEEWRVPPGDSHALADALVRARSNEGETAAVRGHELVASVYNQASFKKKFVEILSSAVRP
jgi:glycosyltransferase involved in cell wall biosynthesis